MDSTPIQFYFDFASPYAYLASEKIDALAERYGRKVQWRPILLGGILKALGTQSLINQTDKADYSLHDIARSARFLGLPYVHPVTFPAMTVMAARAYYWLHERDCGQARRFAHEVFRAYFVHGQDVSVSDVVLELAAKVGADRTALERGVSEPDIKGRVRAETEQALAQGVFGAPWIVVDKEPFWGADRLPQIEAWLATNGF